MGYHLAWAIINLKNDQVVCFKDGQFAVYFSEISAINNAAKIINKYNIEVSIRQVRIRLPWVQ